MFVLGKGAFLDLSGEGRYRVTNLIVFGEGGILKLDGGDVLKLCVLKGGGW